MKLTGGKANQFLRNPGDQVLLALIYGPDEGQVRSKARNLVKQIAGGDENDPFLVTALTKEEQAEDPTRLIDEAASIPMMGGRKIVWLRGFPDSAAKVLTDWLDEPKADTLIVAEGADLTPKNGMRKLAEKHERAASIACYADDQGALDEIIAITLKQAGLGISPDALHFLTARLGADRALTRSELEKLVIYKGEAKGEVSLEDVEAVSVDAAALTLDLAVDAALTGQPAKLDVEINRCFAEAINEIALIRATQNELVKLSTVQDAVANGTSPDQAIKQLRPPLFFKRQPAFKQMLRLWPQKRLAMAKDIMLAAERDCKTTGMPSQAVCHRALLRLANAAAQIRNR